MEDNFKNWIWMDFAGTNKASEDKTGWEGIVVEPPVAPNDLARLGDRLD